MARSRAFVYLLSCGLLLAGTPGAVGQEDPLTGLNIVPADPAQLFQSGEDGIRDALAADNANARRSHLLRALDDFRRAAELSSTPANAFRRAAACALDLAQLALTEDERTRYTQLAGETLQGALDSPGAHTGDALAWARFLTQTDYARAATIEEQETVAEQIVAVYDAAIRDAPNDTARAHVQVALAGLLVTRGEQFKEMDAERLVGKYYQPAHELFELVQQNAPDLITPQAQGLWGVAALHTGRLTGDRALGERARDLLKLLVLERPGDLVQRYNLACAHVVLEDYSAAVEQLRACLRQDERGIILPAVLGDPEWAEARESDAFKKLHQEFDPAADEAFHLGRMRQSAGDRAGLYRVRREAFRDAITHYREAVSIRPGFYQAQMNWLLCLCSLLSMSESPSDHAAIFIAIRERFQAASKLPEADWRLYRRYGQVLMSSSRRVAGVEQRLAMLTEAERALKEGLDNAAFSGERARLSKDVGRCQTLIARDTTERVAKSRLLRSAIEYFEAALALKEKADHTDAYAAWGFALLELGKLEDNRLTFRQAIERLLRALEGDPDNWQAHYNLACCYALLNQADDALSHLEICARTDTTMQFGAMAREDPDLENLYKHERFIALLAEPSQAPPVYIDTRPSLSGK